MDEPPLIGGAPVVTLRADPPADGLGVVEASVLPGRGFMLLQAVAEQRGGRRLELLQAPTPAEAAAQLNGGPEDFAGNRSFAFGGAILAPYANRIRGRAVAGRREIETQVGGRTVRLPRNWGGREPGAETYAMHGLILAQPVTCDRVSGTAVTGRLQGFDGGWPGRLELTFEWRLQDAGLALRLDARNIGAEPAPFAAGWHPYFRLPSGNRRDARFSLPASRMAEVNNYDEVLPTGRLLDVAGTPYDFRAGRPLGDLHLDDCFTGFAPGPLEIELADPGGDFGLRVATSAPPVRAVQIYAPPGESFVAIEPQFNLADPFGAQWTPGVDTGMAWLAPGESVTYDVSVTPFEPSRRPVNAADASAG